MSKYIDADKLKELLKERQEEKDYREVIWLIDSLQQEQPVENLEEEVKSIGTYTPLIIALGVLQTLTSYFYAPATLRSGGAKHLKK